MKKVSFMDMAVCLNCHVFIIWEFIRRYSYTAGVTKDRYGRGYVEAKLCNEWIDKLAKYVAAQDFTYKQPINKRQYLIRDEARLAEEKRNEQDKGYQRSRMERFKRGIGIGIHSGGN